MNESSIGTAEKVDAPTSKVIVEHGVVDAPTLKVRV